MALRVLDLTGRISASTLQIEASIAAEMLTELNRFTWSEARDTYEDRLHWFEERRTLASPKLLEALDALGGGGKPWGSLLGLVAEDPFVHTVPALISRVESTPGRELRLIVLGAHVPSLRERLGAVLDPAADGDERAIDRLLELDPHSYETDPGPFRRLLSLHVEQAKALTLQVLKRWRSEVFAPREEELADVLARDAEAKRTLARTASLERVVEIATNGLRWSPPHPGIRRVLLTPHVAMRPWNTLNEWDDTYHINYPAADESLGQDRSAPPARLSRLYRALDDEKRLRILKLLSLGPAGLQEIADHVGIAKSTAHHHMVILRSAGLITVGTDYQARYSLRTEMLGEVSGWLEAYLSEGSPG